LVAADGGRLELAQPRPPVFAIFLAPASADGDAAGQTIAADAASSERNGSSASMNTQRR
jgi:hypothetical protein